jgi:nitrite reductase/ring-hydroxylating ferredoxin subunit
MSEFQEAESLPRPRAVTTAELGGPPAGTVLCALDDISGEEAVCLSFGQGYERRHVFIVGRSGRPYAYINECPHNHLPLNLRANRFLDFTGERLLCVHHCALFRIEDGYCDAGPCEGHWLTEVSIRVEGGRILAG